MTTATQAGSRATRVWKARVLDVNLENYTVTVVGMHEKKIIPNVPWGSPYQHPRAGEGIYAMPEVGSICWVCEPSDGNSAFVVAWGPVANDGNFRNQKRRLNPGDIFLGTRDGNEIILRRGGVLQMGATPLCQRIFLPINHFIKDFAENYELNTLGGQLAWTVDRSETTTDGSRPARWVLSAKEFADDPNPVAVLEIGSHEGAGDTILSLIVRESGQAGAKLKHSLFLDKTGNMTVVTKGDINWTVGGNVNLKAQKVSVDAMVEVAGATYPVVLDSADLEAWITTVTACLTGTGAAARSPTLVAPTQHAAQKLKSS
jgi:hypothetical protein